MRVVFDTNILVSACWKIDGLEAKTVDLALSGAITPCVSKEVLAEYHDVLSRDKFDKVRRHAAVLLTALEGRARFVKPAITVHVASDEDDNRFLECALAAEADYLITGNLKDYPISLAATKIVNARGFLESTSKR